LRIAGLVLAAFDAHFYFSCAWYVTARVVSLLAWSMPSTWSRATCAWNFETDK
jgi:hypothetical protein